MAQKFDTLERFEPLGLQVIVFFVRNPEEELSSRDVAAKFGVKVANVSGMLRRVVEGGYLTQPNRGGGVGNLSSYAIGPRALRMIGHAEAPTGNTAIGRL